MSAFESPYDWWARQAAELEKRTGEAVCWHAVDGAGDEEAHLRTQAGVCFVWNDTDELQPLHCTEHAHDEGYRL